MKRKLLFPGIFIFGLAIAGFVYYFYTKRIEKVTINLAAHTRLVAQYNRQGKLDGEGILYIDGIMKYKGHFSDGKREGLCTAYYPNGRLENEINYVDGEPDGLQKFYNTKGQLEGFGNWKKGKRCGIANNYFSNGKIEDYLSFDMLGKNFFCLKFDTAGNLVHAVGSLFSHAVYSFDGDQNIIWLKSEKTYLGINDLYITVASPTNFKSRFDISINGRQLNNYQVIEHSLKIRNAFSEAGIYRVKIYGKLMQAGERVVKADSLDMVIIKK